MLSEIGTPTLGVLEVFVFVSPVLRSYRETPCVVYSSEGELTPTLDILTILPVKELIQFNIPFTTTRSVRYDRLISP